MALCGKRSLIYTLLLMICASGLLAQEENIIRIKSGQEAEQALPMDVKYRYPEFRQGTISFYNGQTSSGRLNYNLLLGEMQFINLTRDTLSLAEEQTIREIQIGDHTFHYDAKYGFVEVVQEYPTARLAIQQKLTPLSREKMGAYEQSTGVSSIRDYSSISTSNGSTQKLALKGDLLIAKKVVYVFIDKNQRFRRANRAGILRIFPENKREINTFIEEHKTDFSQPEDLKALLRFCQEVAS